MLWDDRDAQKEPDETRTLPEAATPLERYGSVSPEIPGLAEGLVVAVVDVQAFSGFGLCRTGSKAGGVNALRPFAVEQSVSLNDVASCGNLALLTDNGDA